MSTFKQNCGIPIDFEGFQNARNPQDVCVFLDDFVGASWSTTADAAIWNETLIATQASTGACLDGTDAAQDEACGALKVTTDASADEGDNFQVNGEMFHLENDTGLPLYFEARINVQDVSNLDCFVGLSVTDAEIITGGVTDRVGFELASGTLSAITEKDSTQETTDTAITETDDQWVRVAFFFDGTDKVIFSVDDDDDGVFSYVCTRDIDTSTDDVPNDMMMTPTIEAITGTTATAESMYVDYVLCMQARYHA